ncbi:MAG: chemotaxis protein CheC [Trichlorobacter sp.]|uniref:chemotaxis protein CheC n=1 Tax=Trichlorobacter sp. TaxID=2911007 RepID=UPI00256CEFF7|nr:chemotaxis protein CheC [Trichlorobacter sp.]MDK9719409.1 chemotaxis protein CheC [Trichlorobacter sp.]
MSNPLRELSELEKDALQEIMNIGFGRAAADLAEIINLHVILSVPHIAVLQSDEVISYIHNQIPDTTDMSMITQFFSGKFSGGSFLVFPHGEGRKLLRIFDGEMALLGENYDIDVLEKETLVEVGNIIIGACVGKIAEMLGDVVSYAPPRFFSQEQIFETLDDVLNSSDSFAILFKTVFNFERYNVSGYLFLVSQHSIMPWLKQAIAEFLGPYE